MTARAVPRIAMIIAPDKLRDEEFKIPHAGVLKGHKATLWEGATDHLLSHGAINVAAPVVADGSTITANGPTSADHFATTVLDGLTNRAKQ